MMLVYLLRPIPYLLFCAMMRSSCVLTELGYELCNDDLIYPSVVVCLSFLCHDDI
jgi:hypothetical protein